jgi:hypothetical protein
MNVDEMLEVKLVDSTGQIVYLHSRGAEPAGVRVVILVKAANAPIVVHGHERAVQFRGCDSLAGLPQSEHGNRDRIGLHHLPSDST